MHHHAVSGVGIIVFDFKVIDGSGLSVQTLNLLDRKPNRSVLSEGFFLFALFLVKYKLVTIPLVDGSALNFSGWFSFRPIYGIRAVKGFYHALRHSIHKRLAYGSVFVIVTDNTSVTVRISLDKGS